MSKVELLEVISGLPEKCLERAILNCLSLMAAKSEYGVIESLLTKIGDLKNYSVFKATALSIGVKCAVSANNLPLAMSRLDMLERMGDHPAILNARANALLQIAARLLPDKCTQLMQLWAQLVQVSLPPDARYICKHIGTMLVKQMRKNQDSASADKVLDMMERYLP